MPRPLLIRSRSYPYHVTSRCNNKEFFPLPLKDVWPIMIEELMKEVDDNLLSVHAFVLMGNHFHLLCQTPQENLDVIMGRFLRSVAIKINVRCKQINHLWGNRYKWSIIETEQDYFQVYRYIYQNPIRANICKRIEDYPYSTLRKTSLPINAFIPESGSQVQLIEWLNEKYRSEDEDLIKLGLRKQHFEVRKRKLEAFRLLTLPTGARFER